MPVGVASPGAAISIASTARATRARNRFLVLIPSPARDDEPSDGARLGLSVGRKIGKAVHAEQGEAGRPGGLLAALRSDRAGRWTT